MVDYEVSDPFSANSALLNAIEQNRDELALVFVSHVNYISSMIFDVQNLASKCHSVGAHCIVNLTESVGVVPSDLHEWNVDGAVWGTYKYLNTGAGSICGIFIHEKHKDLLPGLRGSHGNKSLNRSFNSRLSIGDQFTEPDAL